MSFGKTRLYAVLRWIFAGILGFVFMVFSYALLFPSALSCCHSEQALFPILFGVSSLSVLGVVLILLSIWFALPMMSLILAMWGSMVLGSVLSSPDLSVHMLIRIAIYVVIAIISGALWFAYGRGQSTSHRYICFPVISVVSLGWAVCLIGLHLFM